jgi:hypothetical protein
MAPPEDLFLRQLSTGPLRATLEEREESRRTWAHSRRRGFDADLDLRLDDERAGYLGGPMVAPKRR